MNTRPVHIPRPCPALMFAATLGGIAPGFAIAETININPSKDNTLYEYVPADGDLSNALGNHFFTGETAVGELRRGVLAFDITGNVPAGSTITSVTLTLNMSKTPSNTARTVELHRLLADWEEGTSQASGEEGTGAPATPNDATWRHRFFDTILDDGRRGLFRHGEREPVGRRDWLLHLEFGADGCRCAVLAG